MKTSTKVLLGISTVALVGTTVAVVVSDSIVGSLKKKKNRHVVKKFVDENLNGNEKVKNVLENLSDDEVSSVVSILDKIEDGKKKISVTGHSFKEATEEVKNMLSNFVEELI